LEHCICCIFRIDYVWIINACIFVGCVGSLCRRFNARSKVVCWIIENFILEDFKSSEALIILNKRGKELNMESNRLEPELNEILKETIDRTGISKENRGFYCAEKFEYYSICYVGKMYLYPVTGIGHIC
jgi:hypothetical protein